MSNTLFPDIVLFSFENLSPSPMLVFFFSPMNEALISKVFPSSVSAYGSSQLNFALSLENLTEEDANYDLFATFRSITQGFQLSPVFI